MRIFLISFLFFSLACTRKGPALDEAANVRVAGWEDLRLGEGKTFTIDGLRVREFEINKDGAGTRIRILENVAVEGAAQLRRQKLFAVDTLFREQKNPYPGEISEAVQKPSELLPVISKSGDARQDLTRILAPANSRKALGVASVKDIHFRYLWLLIYCKDRRTAVEIETFLPEHKAKNMDLSKWLEPVSCG